jgi:hypothetical protein
MMKKIVGEFMTETRRDVFKTSVISAFGLMSAAAMTGCKQEVQGGGKGGKDRLDLDTTNTVILGWNEYADSAVSPPIVPIWYVFHRAATGWEVYTDGGSLADPNTSSKGSFDNYNWYVRNGPSLTQIKDKFKFTNSSTVVTFKFTGEYLDATSSAYLVGLEQAQPYFSQALWNEIGKR